MENMRHWESSPIKHIDTRSDEEIPEEGAVETNETNEDDTDSSSESETDEILSDMEYWDPSDDTYRSKRTNKEVPEDRTREVIDPNDNDTNSSSESETTSDDEYPEDFGYWDPVTDTYRSKRTNESVPEESMLETTDPNEYDTDSSGDSETTSDIESLEDVE